MSDDGRLSVLQHLEELRKRIVVAGVAVLAGSAVAFTFRDSTLAFLEEPYRQVVGNADQLAVFKVTEPFSVSMRLALFGGFLLASPLVLYQAWAFIHPALTTRERRWAIPVVAIMTVLFVGGVAFGYWTLPRGLEFLLGIQPGLDTVIGVSNYISFTLRFLLVFGVAFLFPVFVFAAAAAGLITSDQLRQWRRWAVLIIVVVGAVVTPSGDPLTLLALSAPLYLFYETTLWLVKLILRK
ncbi:MAG TPA: twin-arginine translocase subunit TatC [Acidimicrobiia bacterium]